MSAQLPGQRGVSKWKTTLVRYKPMLSLGNDTFMWHEQSNVVCTVDDKGSPPHDVEDPCQEPWIIHLARRTRRLLRKWKETPGIKWKNEITPLVPKAGP